MKYAVVVSVLLLTACGHKTVTHADTPDTARFFRSCDPVATKPDGYSHFLCSATDGKQYEVLIKRK